MENENQRALTPKRTKRAAIADLPENVSVFAIQKPTGTKWRVQLGKRFTGGRRVTHDVSSIQAAKKWIFTDAQKLKADPGSLLDLKARAGSTVFELSSAQINEAVAAFKRLKGIGIGMTLTEAVDYAIKHSRPDAGVISVAEAIEKALARKKSKSKSYKDNLGRRWRRFEKWLPPAKRKAIHTVTQLDVRRFLSGCDLEPQGEGNELRNLSVLFSWAVQFHHMTVNPCKGIQTEESGEKEPPRVLTIREVKELIDLALTEIKEPIRVGKGKSGKGKMSIITVYPGDLIPWLTVGLFAGIRPDETLRLDWEDIDFERRQIDLPAKKTKGRTRRIIPMEPNLIAWLKPYRPENGKGRICKNLRWKFRAFQKAAGEKWNPWPKDGLRHSYASYHLAKTQHAGLTSESMGHRDTNMLYRHYRDVIKEQGDIDAFWKLNPP